MSSVTNIYKLLPLLCLISGPLSAAEKANVKSSKTSPAASPSPNAKPTTSPAAKTGSSPAIKSGASPAPTTESAAKKNEANEAACKHIFQKYGIPWQQLWQKRGPELRDEHTGGLSQLSDMTAEHCTEEGPRKDLLGIISKLLNQHNGKIGVMLPLASKPLTRHILKGIEAAVKNAHLDPATTLITLDTQSSPQRVEQLLAQLLYRDQVSTILGGYDTAEIETLRQWSAKLMVPIFILNEPPLGKSAASAAPMVFYSHPTEQALAKAMVAANEHYRHKKVSIMRPNDQHADRLVQSYEAAAKAAGINVLSSVVYDAKRIDQMESAARRLFKLETTDRRDELKRLYEQAKDHAAATGQVFNPKMVALQPVVEQDAVFIADDFRTVRHMAKIFTYLGVRKLPMFGGYEWRSEGLIEPYDSLFSGSYFVDFIGSYLTLPQSIRVPTTSSPYFVAPDQIEEVDFSALGYRSTAAPLMIAKHTELPRRKLDKLIPRVGPKSNPKDINFDENNVVTWPTYLFEVTSQGKGGALTLQP